MYAFQGDSHLYIALEKQIGIALFSKQSNCKWYSYPKANLKLYNFCWSANSMQRFTKGKM